MNRLIERILAHLPWYDPAAAAARRHRAAEARRDATVARRALAEVHRLDLVARRHR